jgi:hypothetical protein
MCFVTSLQSSEIAGTSLLFSIRRITKSLDPALGKISFMQAALLQRSVNRYHVVGMDPDLTDWGRQDSNLGMV